MTSQPFGILASIVDKRCKKMEADGIRHQLVVSADFWNEVETFSTCLKACLDLKGHVGNVIAVVGTHHKDPWKERIPKV
jgi:hypothetical protein